MEKSLKDGIIAIIIDFGLSKVLPRNSNSNQLIIGSIPFLDPEKLSDGNYALNYKSDIYSLGVILWEITSNGRPPFNNINYSLSIIAINIISGVREKPIKGSTISFIGLYTDFWNGNPKFRPEIKNVYKLIHQKDMIYGEKWNRTSKINVSDIDQTKSKRANKQEDKQPAKWLDKAVSDGHINYVKYDKFTDHIEIGSGGFGRVFKCKWKDNELIVALKCLKVDTNIDEEIIEDFINELNLLRKVCSHPNVITFHGVTKDDSEIMELYKNI
ncbi:kinase-like domain-containing protein [Gigaspora rosea]|uniref:Kinase-like domain-containing protein n=1 Tax=Gigaspora rosea TaxID=44941 RepID=A0A397W3T5_9GLOM|nr:kinase-like domain-containing protein [Gigaspora rosea]